MTDRDTAPDWRDDIFDALVEAGVKQVAYVPDAGHKKLIERTHAANDMRAVSVATEEDAVACLAGAWLGGDKGALLMQSSGVGNTINMLSLMTTCRFPLPMFVTMRGEWGEFNSWQMPMGGKTQAHFELAGVKCYRVERPEDVGPTVRAALDQAYNGDRMTAVLLAQKLVGTKKFSAGSVGDNKQ
ncbi:MAG: thiamine pyrophosphate-binding protein [Alphaproteobacteria bacterium]